MKATIRRAGSRVAGERSAESIAPAAEPPEPVVRRGDRWLEVRAALGNPFRDPWEALETNARLPWPCRLLADSGGLYLGVDLLVDGSEPDLDATLHSLRRARTMIGLPMTDELGLVGPVAPELTARLAEAGWEGNSRSHGRFAITLPTDHGFHQAVLESRPTGIRASIDLADGRCRAASCRAAIARLLLLGSATCRLIRPAVTPAAIVLEGWIGDLSPAAIDALLGCLTVGINHLARETQVLTSERMAGLYLQYTHQEGSVGNGAQH